MKFEEILPEIRNGRTFIRSGRYSFNSSERVDFSLLQLLDDEWGLEPLKKELSREDLAKAWGASVAESRMDSRHVAMIYEAFCKRLGL